MTMPNQQVPERPQSTDDESTAIDHALIASTLQRIDALPLDQRAAEYDHLYADLSQRLEQAVGQTELGGR
ncbi:hypothetical protein [Pseudoclavibacter sp. 13-3]|uniref:hypothetical protein n=1 Tax=Pseudoclavibacter sp. 13-3 TaxID=2901228 RepID=UPI001E42CB3C|nr:hypothetical protein [Pseudoclavibacter sp. 13-3]MCD7102136.1 hypothetical protein [Pseudoclavibacter sp. 13-3]